MSLIEKLLQHPKPSEFLKQHPTLWQDGETAVILANTLKQQADHNLRHDLERARQLANLIFELGDLSQNAQHTALGHRAHDWRQPM